MTDPVRRRTYHSPLRAEQALRTRLRILEAASELFHAHGYATTTISAISRAAGVSPDTVYDAFRSKRGLLKELIDNAAVGTGIHPSGGTDGGGTDGDGTDGGGTDGDHLVSGVEDPHAIRRETDQQRQIEIFAAGTSRLLERTRPLDDILRGAAAADREVAEIRDDQHLRRRRQSMITVAGWIAERGPLRDRTPIDEAAAILWTLTTPEVHHMLRVTWQWTAAQYEAWLCRTLTDALLPASLPASPQAQTEPD